MVDQPERPVAAVSVSISSGSGLSASMGYAAPVGALSRKDRIRAGRTSLEREGTSGFLLVTALPGIVTLQHRGTDGIWQTRDKRRASRRGRTRIELPREAASPPTSFRVVFSPKNANLASWISETIDR